MEGSFSAEQEGVVWCAAWMVLRSLIQPSSCQVVNWCWSVVQGLGTPILKGLLALLFSFHFKRGESEGGVSCFSITDKTFFESSLQVTCLESSYFKFQISNLN